MASDNLKGLDTRWTRHLQGEDKKNFEALVRNSTQVLTRLKGILEEKDQEVQSTSFSLSDFDSPAWAQKTAFRNGQLSVLRQLKELIPF